MIDWHSHILPRVDDGSKSVEESVQMLKLLSEQGIETVIATPHFYADDNSVEEFLFKRDKSIEVLNRSLFYEAPQILLGAEICYYPGISNLEGLNWLCIEGTDLLLIEMPMSKWTTPTINEIVELADSGEYTVVLAHIERYLKYVDVELINKLRKSGILIQINASFINNPSTRRKALKLLQKGTVQVLGSDCHNTDSRRPRIGEAYDNIRRELGEAFIENMNEFGYFILQ